MSDQPQEPMPGQPTDLPLPPEVDRAWGYRSDARYVAFHWMSAGDEVVYDDGRSSGTGHSWSFLAYRRHRAVAGLLADYNLGYSDQDAEHCVIIDRQVQRASIAPLAEARAFLAAQHPPSDPLTPEQAAELQRRIDELVSKGWREEIVDMEQVRRAMEEQRGRVGRMIAWLDMAPTPPQEGRGQ